MRVAIAFAVGLAACNQCPQPDPVGGTAKARGVVRNALDAFYDGIGTNQICVTKVEMVEHKLQRDGHYNRATRKIGVDWRTELGPDRVATHELCHALDHQHQIRWRRDHLWTYDPPRIDLDTKLHVGEAFADTCEIGPLSIQLVGEACDTDTKGSRAHQVLQHWFPNPVAGHGTTVVALEEIGSWRTHTAIDDLIATGSRDATVRFDLSTETGAVSLALDVLTGEPMPLPLPLPRSDEPWMPDGWFPLDWASTGDATLSVGILRATNGGTSKRLLWTDSSGVTSLGCSRPHEAPFAAGGELYTAWAEGDTVVWGRWVPVDEGGRDPGRPGGAQERPTR